jgi:hypothetical protein
MRIKLEDGPRAGEEFDLPDSAVRSGRIVVPLHYGGYFRDVAVYDMRRWVPDNFCQMPLHLWMFSGTRV